MTSTNIRAVRATDPHLGAVGHLGLKSPTLASGHRNDSVTTLRPPQSAELAATR